MRVLLSTAVLLALGLLALSTSRTSAQGQNIQAGITSGEKLSLSFDPAGGGHFCTVIEVRGDFLGCRVEGQGRAQEEWYNLRFVARINRPSTQR